MVVPRRKGCEDFNKHSVRIATPTVVQGQRGTGPTWPEQSHYNGSLMLQLNYPNVQNGSVTFTVQ